MSRDIKLTPTDPFGVPIGPPETQTVNDGAPFDPAVPIHDTPCCVPSTEGHDPGDVMKIDGLGVPTWGPSAGSGPGTAAAVVVNPAAFPPALAGLVNQQLFDNVIAAGMVGTSESLNELSVAFYTNLPGFFGLYTTGAIPPGTSVIVSQVTGAAVTGTLADPVPEDDSYALVPIAVSTTSDTTGDMIIRDHLGVEVLRLTGPDQVAVLIPGLHSWRALTQGGGGGSSYPRPWSQTFEIPTEDVFAGDYKISLNQPMPGMVSINVYDLGVINSPDRCPCYVWDETDNVQLTDWTGFASWAAGTYCGSAPAGHTIRLTVLGSWDQD